MHVEAMRWVADCLAKIGTVESVLELGSRDVNGSPRGLLPGVDYVGVDVTPGPGVDVVGDAVGYRGPPVDVVISTEVLEHAADPEGIIVAAAANLRPGGHLIVTCAGPGRAPHSGVDGGPVRAGEHYAAPTLEGLLGMVDAAGLEWVHAVDDDRAHDLRVLAVKPSPVLGGIAV